MKDGFTASMVRVRVSGRVNPDGRKISDLIFPISARSYAQARSLQNELVASPQNDPRLAAALKQKLDVTGVQFPVAITTESQTVVDDARDPQLLYRSSTGETLRVHNRAHLMDSAWYTIREIGPRGNNAVAKYISFAEAMADIRKRPRHAQTDIALETFGFSTLVRKVVPAKRVRAIRQGLRAAALAE